MKLLSIGLNWKTPIRIREMLAFDGPKAQAAYDQFRAAYPDAELALLSTCNRTEVFAARSAGTAKPDIDDLCEFLARSHDLRLTDFYDYLYFHEDASTALHLFKVAAGLDSLILGEAQILGQVRDAYQSAVAGGTCGPALHALMQRSLAVAKRVHTETSLSKGRLSIASAAVDYLRGVFEHFDDKMTLVIGAGKMAELTLTHLRELKPKGVLVCNRHRPRAEELASRFGGRAVDFDALPQALTEADIVISSTGADEPIVTVATFRQVMKSRKNRLMAIIDLAVPRDFETEIGSLDNVLLWNIDDLETVRNRTLRSRERELDKALKIVDAEAEAFLVSMAIQQSSPLIGQLEQEYERITQAELEWLFPQLNGLAETDKQKIRQFARRLKNKFLHPPKAALRAEAKAGRHHGLLEAMRKLFGLNP